MGENRSAPSLTLAGIYPDGDRKFTARNIYKPPCGSNHHGGGDERRPSEGAGIPVSKGEILRSRGDRRRRKRPPSGSVYDQELKSEDRRCSSRGEDQGSASSWLWSLLRGSASSSYGTSTLKVASTQ